MNSNSQTPSILPKLTDSHSWRVRSLPKGDNDWEITISLREVSNEVVSNRTVAVHVFHSKAAWGSPESLEDSKIAVAELLQDPYVRSRLGLS